MSQDVNLFFEWVFAIVLFVGIPMALLILGVEKMQRWAGKRRESSAEREAAMMRRTRDEVRRHGG